ncbi:hypothetical protein OQA88_10659 [Cercophora sp. LCS_1]
MADAQGLHRCPICFKGYKRREHLQRHRASHNSERPHRCILCSASFQRTDVLKRHLQTCDGTSSQFSGRRRSCDRCVRQKKGCNSLQPCQNCEKRAVSCQYSNLSGQSQTPAASPAPALAPGPAPSDAIIKPPTHPYPFEDVPFHELDVVVHDAVSQYPLIDDQSVSGVSGVSGDPWFGLDFTPDPELPVQDRQDTTSTASESRGYSFNFLYDFTSRTGLVSSFECATLEQRQQIVANFDHAYLQHQQLEPLVPVPPVFPTGSSISPPSGFAGAASIVPGHGPVPWSCWLQNPIIIKLQRIVLLVKDVVTVKPKNSIVTLTWSPELEQKCIEFFTPYRFAKFIELYWSVWNPNVNIVHRPSFDQANSKSILLAAMALIGACVSPDPQDNEDARIWFNCVEEMVFTDDDFCSDVELTGETSPQSVLSSWRKLQALQASYIVCLAQNWEGTDASKRRIRRHRFGTVVSVARDIGIENARHLDYSLQSKHDFVWSEYVVREELIRTFLWIFLLDTAFVIFNNLPHRMVIKEMRMHLASPEACFQALTAEECIQQLHSSMSPTSPLFGTTLRDAIENMCMNELAVEEQRELSQLGPLNLFAIVSAFHAMIFQHQNSFGVDGQLVPIRRGLRNWIGVWEWYFDSWAASFPYGTGGEACLPPKTLWKRVGFIRFSPEYWLLGTLLTDRIAAPSASAGLSQDKASLSRAATNSMTVGGRGPGRSIEPILDKYDQTSMRQVNDLITNFQKFNVD